MKKTIGFEKRDWEEIVAALESKIEALKRGDLGAEDHPGEDKKWIAHLRSIIRKIEGSKCTGINFAIFKKHVVTIKGGK